MRILQILNTDEIGGIMTLARMIEHGLQRSGHAVRTEYLFDRPDLGAAAKLRCAARTAGRILEGGFDALIAYQATASILVGTVGRLQGCRLRIVHQTCTPGETAAPLRLADRIVGSLGLYTANIANSAFTRAEFAGYPESYRRSLRLIEHGLDLPAGANPPERTRRRYALPEAAPLLLNVGRLVDQKNQTVLIRALAKVPDAHLVLAGAGTNESGYRALADRLGVADRIHFLGALSLDEIADLYAAATIFVFPSCWETFGLAAVEAAMAGLPMVVADIAVLREVLSSPAPQPVAFVGRDDADGWAAAIRDALARPASADRLRAYASSIAHKYSRQRMIGCYEELLRA